MNMQNKPHRILICKLRHHGDVLLATPVADVVKHVFPDCEVDMLVYQETADMVRNNRQLRRIFTIDRNWKKQGLLKQAACEFRLLKELKEQHYDWVLNLSDQWRAGILAKLCGRQSAGIAFQKRNNVLWKFCHTFLGKDLGNEHHITKHNLAVLGPLGFSLDHYHPEVRLDVCEADRLSLQNKLRGLGWQGEGYVLVHPGSRWIFKCWDDDKTMELLQRLLDSGENIVLTAAPDQRERRVLEQVTGRLKTTGNAKLWVLSGSLNLCELAAAIDRSKLFIGVDSAPMHMAAALDKPQVALFGPSWVSRWRPYSDKASVVWAGDYGDLPHPDSINTNDEKRWLGAIPVEAVWRAVQEKLVYLRSEAEHDSGEA
ncbi:putative lipopolysaccharide heptosyltransferase III [Neisseria animaloris]|nr:putative lipopolysaccharide heptosyltransferase III [Neisseria animaloris]OSI08011.1 putative lipopolysaccharide heptosyltransferase III [Neisseria animaloris]